jgi:hypothetical protein
MTALHSRRVYLDGTDLERDSEAFMRLRLTYAGPLLSSNPLAPDKRIEHKHHLRRAFHKQIKEHWESHPFLGSYHSSPGVFRDKLPDGAASKFDPIYPNKKMSLAQLLGAVYGHSGYNFAPLVWKENGLHCSLRILCLRRDTRDAVSPGRDIDNRMKTLIDALCAPSARQGSPMKDGVPLPPGPGEDPFYVLLDDDRQIEHLEVETDKALELDENNPTDESFVRLIISVEIRPFVVDMFNLSYA